MKLIIIRCFLALLLALGWAAASYALEPPTAEQIEQYKQDGTWEEQVRNAYAIGNQKMAPELVEKANYKLRRLEYQAAGKSGAEIDEILPAPIYRGMPTVGDVKMFVLLIEFDGYPHIAADTQAAVYPQVFGPENTGSMKYPYESLNAYYNRSSYNLLNLQGTVFAWYNAGNRSAVAETAAGREELIKNAINYFDAAGHDFSQYDNDGDGDIDYFAVIWTGPPGKWASFWWGSMTGFNSSYVVDGKRLTAYSWQEELSNYPNGDFSPGTLIHETGHALGLPDYYDYDDTIGPRGGVGGIDEMDGGKDHNAFSKFLLDWLTPTVISAAGTSQQRTLASSASQPDALLIMPNATGSPFEEFFMVQHRKREQNDKYLPADGLLIWHVDARLNATGWDYLYNNSFTEHKMLRLMEADGLEEIERGKRANAGDFYIAGKSFTNATFPSSKKYSGYSSGIKITDIVNTANSTTFNASIEDVPSITIVSPAQKDVIGSGIVSITAETVSNTGIAQVQFFVNGSLVGTDSSAPYAANFDASGKLPGIYTVKAVATDLAGLHSFAEASVYLVTRDVSALIIDIASDNDSGEAIGAALAKNNVKPIYRNMIGDAVDPSVYSAAFVCLGYAKENHVLTSDESQVLSTYLDKGGKLYLEGGDTWFWDTEMPVHNYFGINGIEGGEFDLSTVSGSGIDEGISFASVGSYAWVDRLAPVNDGTAIWQNSNPVYTVGIANQTATYRTVGCSFEFGNIPGDTLRKKVMATYLSFFGIEPFVPPPAETNFLPAVFKLLL